ncbi:hypothetical protein SAY86_024204 [Trapa natans]|uniref:Uncharacterized protein n=1 Tax=Trapa natans TaxID=22666 RepID=A0AAN7LYS3_TRANT|nr:hypothetical protein SAY86_024204 [Trapa natans]
MGACASVPIDLKDVKAPETAKEEDTTSIEPEQAKSGQEKLVKEELKEEEKLPEEASAAQKDDEKALNVT